MSYRTRRRIVLSAMAIFAAVATWAVWLSGFRQGDEIAGGGAGEPSFGQRSPSAAGRGERVGQPELTEVEGGRRVAATSKRQTDSQEATQLARVRPTVDPRPAPPSEEPEIAHLIGRVVLPNGIPASGVDVQLASMARMHDDPEIGVMLDDQGRTSGATGAEGRFDLAFRPNPDRKYRLDVHKKSFVRRHWDLEPMQPGSTTDIGDLVLVAAGSITGHVRGSDRKATASQWVVSAWRDPESQDTSSFLGVEHTDKSDGAFQIDGITPGFVTLVAESAMFTGALTSPPLWVESGQTTDYDFEYQGPDLDSRLLVIFDSAPGFAGLELAELRVIARDELGREWDLRREEGRMLRYVVDDLPAGPCSVKIVSSIHTVWTKEDVRPGTTQMALLEGNASIELNIVDQSTAMPIHSFTLEARYADGSSGDTAVVMRNDGRTPSVGSRIHRMVAADCTLAVSAEGYETKEVRLDGLEPGESRKKVRVALDRALASTNDEAPEPSR